MTYYNGTFETAAEALIYLAEHKRPIGGQERFNSEHLHQLAGEIATMGVERDDLRERLASTERLAASYSQIVIETAMAADEREADVRDALVALRAEMSKELHSVSPDCRGTVWSLRSQLDVTIKLLGLSAEETNETKN